MTTDEYFWSINCILLQIDYVRNYESHDFYGKQEFRRKDFGRRLLAAEGEGAVRVRGVSEVKQYPSGGAYKSTAKVITAKFLLSISIGNYPDLIEGTNYSLLIFNSIEKKPSRLIMTLSIAKFESSYL